MSRNRYVGPVHALLAVALFLAVHAVWPIDGRAAQGDITTIAGNGTLGPSGDGGPALDTSFGYTMGIALDSAGHLYIADYYNHRIRRVDAATGIITTVAGTGTEGGDGDGGPATLAQLYYPTDVAVDGADNFYVAAVTNRTIRKVDAATGIITTVAGGGYSDADDIPATAASLLYPRGVTVDATGNLYIADEVGHRVRRVDAATGIITTVAGTGAAGDSGDDGLATSAQLRQPWKVALDSLGHLYIADTANHRVRMVDAETGIITTVAGNGVGGFSGDDGLAEAASLLYPVSVTLDGDNNLFITDHSNNRIRRVDAATGIITTVAGNGEWSYGGDGGPATAASLRYPKGIVIDAAGNLLISDSSNQRIRLVEAAAPPWNQPPIADAGADQVVEATSPLGAAVALSGAGSSDPDNDSLTYIWSWLDAEGAIQTAAGLSPIVTVPLGTTAIVLDVDDGHGHLDSDGVSVTVVDTAPPSITAALVPVRENGRAGTYRVSITVEDIVDPAPDVAATLNGLAVGDGDIVMILPGNVSRVTTSSNTIQFQDPEIVLVVTAIDAAGNSATETSVTVP